MKFSTEMQKRKLVIAEIMEGYNELYDAFHKLSAEHTTLLIAVHGTAFFEDDPQNKITVAAEAARFQLEKNNFLKAEIIKNAIRAFAEQL